MKTYPLVLLFVALFAIPASAQTVTQSINQTDTELDKYQQAINARLRTFRNEEKKFIADVFTLVEQGRLPKKLVDRSFLWVQKKRPHSNLKFIYFERVLRILATKARKPLPAFDTSIYNLRGSSTVAGTTVGASTVGGSTVPSHAIGASVQNGNVVKGNTVKGNTARDR